MPVHLPVPLRRRSNSLRHLGAAGPDAVKQYPSIGAAALKEEQAAVYRLWLMYRHLDPVLLPIKIITKRIGEFKAHLYAAWHSGRKRNNPISREVQGTLTGIPERTQRHYCRVARIGRQTNIAIGSRYTSEDVENQAWQQGKAVFKFTDYQGKQGRKGATYIAWHLPNNYTGPHQQTTTGSILANGSGIEAKQSMGCFFLGIGSENSCRCFRGIKKYSMLMSINNEKESGR